MSIPHGNNPSRPFKREGDANARPRGNGAPRRRPAPQQGGEVVFEDRPTSMTDALIALDLDLMKLLTKRSRLVQRLRGGKDRAATPRAIQDEKAIRTAWEKNALSFSKDPRFSRELFNLLQELKMISKVEAEGSDGFLLSPARKPVAMNIHGPACGLAAKIQLALAAALGQKVALAPVLFTDDMGDFIAALGRAGTEVEKKANGAATWFLSLPGKAALTLSGATLHVGECPFALHLFAFLATGKPGTLRITGDAGLKNLDLAGLRAALPRLGARLSHVVPRSKGLPVNLENSGMLPTAMEVPAELPFEGVCALVVAAAAWNQAMTLDFSALPAAIAASALATVQPVLAACGVQLQVEGHLCTITPATVQVPAQPAVPMDALLSAYLLALPAFVGGRACLQGQWPSHMASAADAAALLSWAGVTLAVEAGAVTAVCDKEAFATALHGVELEGEFLPLYVVLAARACQMAKGEFVLPYPLAGRSLSLANELFFRLDLVCDGAAVHPVAQGTQVAAGTVAEPGTEAGAEVAAEVVPAIPWTSPSPYWSMALTLAALTRPGLRLVNPGSVTAVMPSYWGIINSLPAPFDPAAPSTKPKEQSDAPVRRRIIAE
ncbi:hypothetical protein [Desulfovibrio cuneatus]|uniref:hypothetical protein n=1 Tax=Desulfovibrio cuneatus TaxID=159728 RepID=UPI000417C5A3|nr:hypothetical protein [Desulfovibrio cuneatus]